MRCKSCSQKRVMDSVSKLQVPKTVCITVTIATPKKHDLESKPCSVLLMVYAGRYSAEGCAHTKPDVRQQKHLPGRFVYRTLENLEPANGCTSLEPVSALSLLMSPRQIPQIPRSAVSVVLA